MGKTDGIVGPDRNLGGLTSRGLGLTDTGNKAGIGGLAREFYHRIWKHYDTAEAWKWQKKSEYGGQGQGTPAIDGAQRTMWIFEPHVAEKVFEDLVKEYQIPVHHNEWLNRETGVKREGDRITSITMLSGLTFSGKMFIDATYEGDLMAAASVDYHVGREANSVYGETLNGVQAARSSHHQFNQKVDPYVKPGDPSSGLRPAINHPRPRPESVEILHTTAARLRSGRRKNGRAPPLHERVLAAEQIHTAHPAPWRSGLHLRHRLRG